MAARPPKHGKDKKSFVPIRSHRTNKITLTDVQRVKVKVINWKRCSVRPLLLISYVTLVNLVGYMTIMCTCFYTILEFKFLKWTFICFFLNLLLYFFGASAAVRAIEFAWNPIKFAVGIISVIIAIIGNCTVALVGNKENAAYSAEFLLKKSLCDKIQSKVANESNIPDEYNRWGFIRFSPVICGELDTAKKALFLMYWIIPPVATVCIVISGFAAVYAIYMVPRRLSKADIDSAWLQPYETYDYYVGRNIPRIPGYDGGYEGALADGHQYLVSSSSSSSSSSSDDENVENPDAKKGAKKKRPTITGHRKLSAHPQLQHTTAPP